MGDNSTIRLQSVILVWSVSVCVQFSKIESFTSYGDERISDLFSCTSSLLFQSLDIEDIPFFVQKVSSKKENMT